LCCLVISMRIRRKSPTSWFEFRWRYQSPPVPVPVALSGTPLRGDDFRYLGLLRVPILTSLLCLTRTLSSVRRIVIAGRDGFRRSIRSWISSLVAEPFNCTAVLLLHLQRKGDRNTGPKHWTPGPRCQSLHRSPAVKKSSSSDNYFLTAPRRILPF
jgi:hypothetical protein